MDYDRVRKDEANKLGVQLRTLDEKVKAARRADDTSESLPFPVVAAWPEPIVPADLLGSIVATINRFLILSPEEVIASALSGCAHLSGGEVPALAAAHRQCTGARLREDEAPDCPRAYGLPAAVRSERHAVRDFSID